MCKVLSVVYCSLFLINLVRSHDILEGSTDNVKHSKHRHHRERSTIVVERKKTSEMNTENPTTAEILKDNIEEHITDKPIIYLSKAIEPDLITTENDPENYHTTTDTTANVSKTINITEDSSSEDSSSSDSNTSRNGSHDSSSEETELNDDADEVFTVDARKSFTQDPVLDLRARSGYIQEEDLNGDTKLQETTEIGYVPEYNDKDNLRSGKVSTEDDEYIPNGVYDLSTSPSQTNNDFNDPQPITPNYPRSQLLYNTLQNSRRRFSPILETSQETYPTYPNHPTYPTYTYPTQNNREMLQGNSLTQPYFGLLPNSKIAQYNDPCPTCYQRLTLDRGSRRSSHENGWKMARAEELDLSNSNAYPLVQDKDAEVYRSGVPPNDIVYPQTQRDLQNSRERNFQLPSIQPDPYSRLLLQMPQYVSRTSPMFRRLGFNVPRFV